MRSSLSTQSIERLLRACSRGDGRAQMEVYQRYHQAMYHAAFRILNDPMEAEDQMQEGFMDAFSKLSSFRAEASFGSWLKRIIINRCLNQLKANNRGFGQESLEERHQAIEDIPDRAWQAPADIEIVKDAIQQLPDGYRTILSLYLLEGYDHEEIAQIMGISPGTSRSQYTRAKAKLREMVVGGEKREARTERRDQMRNPKPETQNPKPKTRNPKPKTRNPKPKTRNPKPKTRNPKPKTHV